MSPTASSRLIVASRCRAVVDPLEVDLVGAGELVRAEQVGVGRGLPGAEAAPYSRMWLFVPSSTVTRVHTSTSGPAGVLERQAVQVVVAEQASWFEDVQAVLDRRSPRSSRAGHRAGLVRAVEVVEQDQAARADEPGGRRLRPVRERPLADRILGGHLVVVRQPVREAAVHEGRGRAHALEEALVTRARAAIDAIAGERRAAVDGRCRPGEGRARVAGERGEAGWRAGEVEPPPRAPKSSRRRSGREGRCRHSPGRRRSSRSSCRSATRRHRRCARPR